MKVGERLVSLLSGIILGVVGIVFFLVTIGQADMILERLMNLSSQERMWALAVALITLILTVILWMMTFQRRREEQTIIHQTPFGEIRIAVSAVENLALKSARRIKGVKDAYVRVRADSTGLDVFIEITVLPDLSIPQISEEIRVKVDEYIFETVGIRVNSVKVLVTKVSNETSKTRVE